MGKLKRNTNYILSCSWENNQDVQGDCAIFWLLLELTEGFMAGGYEVTVCLKGIYKKSELI